MKLNQEQKEAIENNHPFLFLYAGAGTGKTRTIIEKINLLLKNEVDPNKILAITFTVKAAQELKLRLKNENVLVFTFHGLCYQELEKTGIKINIENPEYLPFNQLELLKISNYKNSLKKRRPPLVYYEYQRYLNLNKQIDFDDLLLLFLNKTHKEQYKTKFDYIFIDEFQDTNNLQYEVLKRLIGPMTKVFAVGDPDQSIYRFRGANPDIINKYIKDFKAKIYKLSTNYRCSENIIKAANQFIAYNHKRIDKKLVGTNLIKEEPTAYIFDDQEAETKYILNLIKTKLNQLIPKSEIAVLYRNHDRALYFKKEFKKTYMAISNPDNEITITTLHQAKGLEFKVVIILGLEKGLLPANKENRIQELEEERRLFFVGMTRAKETLIMTSIKYSHDLTHYKPSIFLRESGAVIHRNPS